MLKHGKSYIVTKRTGTREIYRGGVRAGTWPEIGYDIRIPGVCSAIAGTELAAHALAEVYKNVSLSSRRWVLTEDEYNEHIRILEEDDAALMEAFPYSPAEERAVDEHNSRYAQITEKSRETIKRALLNTNPYEYIIWNNETKRPEHFPVAEEIPAPRM